MAAGRVLIGLGAGVAALALSAPLWLLPALGSALVVDNGPAPADLAVVLGGDLSGGRILRAAELVRQGYVPAVLVSGPNGLYDRHECDFSIAYAVSQGYPRQWFIPFPHEAHSTRAEALAVVPELLRRNVHRVLLVTTDFHTRRALRLFRAAARARNAPIEMRVVAVCDSAFRPGSWWKNREGQEVAFLEWSKTIAAAFGM